MSSVIVVIGAGSIGQAIARRVSAGKQVLLADLRQENADAAAKVLKDAGFLVSTASVDVSKRTSVHALAQTAVALGEVTGVIHAAGVSPTQASPETILAVDLYGTALVLEEFGNVIARGGSGVVIGLVQAVFQAKDIDPKMRELIILRSAYLLDCPYEWQANVSGRAAAVTAALTDRQDLLRVPICCTPTSIRELSLSRHARWVECICLSELRLTLSPPYLLAGLRSHSRGSDLGQR
jgi:NAD(P)-dependent dehydrogenase (short-subunit alcohol dehydrogenase family)